MQVGVFARFDRGNNEWAVKNLKQENRRLHPPESISDLLVAVRRNKYIYRAVGIAVLRRISYRPMSLKNMVGPVGLEPTTNGL